MTMNYDCSRSVIKVFMFFLVFILFLKLFILYISEVLLKSEICFNTVIEIP